MEGKIHHIFRGEVEIQDKIKNDTKLGQTGQAEQTGQNKAKSNKFFFKSNSVY